MPYKPLTSLTGLIEQGFDHPKDQMFDIVDQREILDLAIHHLNKLSPISKQAIQMRFGLHGDAMSYESIGNVLGVSRETARKRVNEGLRELNVRLA